MHKTGGFYALHSTKQSICPTFAMQTIGDIKFITSKVSSHLPLEFIKNSTTEIGRRWSSK